MRVLSTVTGLPSAVQWCGKVWRLVLLSDLSAVCGIPLWHSKTARKQAHHPSSELHTFCSFYNQPCVCSGWLCPKCCCQSLVQEACSLQYYFLVLWKILGVLPPSKTYVEQLKSGNSDPSESDILHTLRWSSRLRVSTYVNWIKVSFIILTLRKYKQQIKMPWSK